MQHVRLSIPVIVRADRQTHGIAESFLRGYDATLHRLTVAADRLHSECRNATLAELRQHLIFETVKVGVENVEGHLHGVEWETDIQHLQVDLRVLVAGESDETNLALLFSLAQSFGGAVGPNE